MVQAVGERVNVWGAYASHHIQEGAPRVITYTNTYTCQLCHLSCIQLGRPSVCLPEFPDCVPVCLPLLCACLFIFLPVCLPPLWSQATRAFLIASSLLQDQNTVKQSMVVLSVSRRSRQRETKWEAAYLHSQANVFILFYQCCLT